MHEIGVRRCPSGVVTVTSASATSAALATAGSAIATPAATHDPELAARHLAERFELLPVVLEVILIAHGSSSLTPDSTLFRRSTLSHHCIEA